MVSIGDDLPHFALENQHGETISSTALGVGKVFLVFYPWAFSRVCGSELSELQSHLENFQHQGIRVVGISVDHKFALRSYADQVGIKFDLLADFWPHGEVARIFGAFQPDRGVAGRFTYFLLDGRVKRIFSSLMSTPRKISQYLE